MGEELYNEDGSVAIDSTGTLLTLDTDDRPFVSVVLHDAGASADYVVEGHYKDSATDSEWHNLADNDATQGFRFEGRVPERYVRVRIDANAAAGGNTAVLSINATG